MSAGPSSTAPWASASTSGAAPSPAAAAAAASAAMPPPTASPAPAVASGSGSGTGKGALLSIEQVANDSSIFTHDGWIVFPRSDGAADYQPPNVAVPAKSDREVNYFHVYKADEVDKYDWRSKVGQKLAEHFGKPKASTSGKTWRLRWPKNYDMTEQRKGAPTSLRTDPYLFGSAAHRFRSAPEFFPHAVWLLRDPSLSQANCECKYCTGKKTMGGDSVKMSRAAPAKSKPVASAAMQKKDSRKGATGRRQKPLQLPNKSGVQIMARPVKSRNHMPGLPTRIASAPQRDQELPHGTPKLGQCEGYRVGEMCFARLDPPVFSPSGDAECAIEIFPVRIDGKTFVAEVDEVGGTGLEGHVTQRPVYNVQLLGSEEVARIDEEHLMPFLAGRVPPGLQKTVYGNPAEFPWLETGRGVPKLHLFPDHTAPGNVMPRASYKTVVAVFAYAVQSVSMLRSIYTLTDQFSRDTLKQAAPPTVSAAAGRPAASPSPSLGAGASLQPGAAKEEEVDTNAYWQGIMFGCERIWVGDTVRLDLSPSDIETMMEALTPQCRLLGVLPDASAPYLMRLKAIFLPRNKNKKAVEAEKGAAAPATATATAEASTQNGAGPSASVSTFTPHASQPAGSSTNAAGDVSTASTAADEEEEDERDELMELDELAEEEADCSDADRVLQIDAEKQRITEKLGPRVRLAGDVYQVLEQTEYSRRQATGGMAPASALGSSARPTYVAPTRAFVAETNNGLLPPSNMVPRGFVLQRVNQATVEIECAATQLAGRLWSSFAPSGVSIDGVLEQRQRAYTPTESVEDERILLSLAGLIPGSVKNVGALSWHPDRIKTMGTCQETARSLLRIYIASEWNREHGIIDDDAASGAGGKSPVKGRKRKSLASAAEGSASPATATAMQPISAHAAAHATPTASKKARKSAGSGVAASPATSTPAGRGAAAGASKSAARDVSPPLPPGWVKKTSRNNPTQIYFAHVGRKVTSWERPTE